MWEDFKEKYKPYIEGAKEVGRWLTLFVLSWLITETLKQINIVPETATVKVWLFNYVIPIKLLVNTLLTLLGRFIDKSMHEIGLEREAEGTKNNPITSFYTKGITRF